MLWVILWTVLVLAALGVFGLIARSLWRKGVALARELGAASDSLSAVTDRWEQPSGPPAEPAVFQDPGRLRVERERAKAARSRARHRSARAG